jgi:hypothetical protein
MDQALLFDLEDVFPSISWDLNEQIEKTEVSESAIVEITQSLFSKKLKQKQSGSLARSKAMSCLIDLEASSCLGRKPEQDCSLPLFLVG